MAQRKKGISEVANLSASCPVHARYSDCQRNREIASVALALITAKQMGWTIVAAEPAAGRIEADERSFWMGFTDDIVLRVTASGSGSRVDMRSASRHGRSDLGVNAARVRAYFARLKMAAGAS